MTQDHHTAHLHCVHSDNQQAIDARLQVAATYCRENGVRFTVLRREIYEIILQADKPLGAYDVLGYLQQSRTQQAHDDLSSSTLPQSQSNKPTPKPIAPPTVYRTLEFLLAQGFIHQLTSINAFVPCCHPRDKHVAAFLICKRCGQVQECSSLLVQEVVGFAQQTMGFLVDNTVMELAGLCQRCQHTTEPRLDNQTGN